MQNKSEQGFTYVDVMIAIVILAVGILALLSAITGAVFQSKGQEQQLDSKQIALSTMESIMSVKETSSVARWIRVGNVGTNPDPVSGAPQGIFVNGLQPVTNNPGPDQTFGTPDDAGPDNTFGTADDPGIIIPGFQRQIVITDQCDPDRPSPNCPTPGTFAVRVRSVVVTVTYSVGTIQRQEQLRTILTDYFPSSN